MDADVAQLVEQLIRNEQVTGSCPVVGSVILHQGPHAPFNEVEPESRSWEQVRLLGYRMGNNHIRYSPQQHVHHQKILWSVDNRLSWELDVIGITKWCTIAFKRDYKLIQFMLRTYGAGNSYRRRWLMGTVHYGDKHTPYECQKLF